MSQKIIPGSRELAQQIRRRRQELGLTIEEAASRADVGIKTWCRYEAGESIRREKSKGICKALNWHGLPGGEEQADTVSVEELKRGKAWSDYLENSYGIGAAVSFAIGSGLLLDHIEEDMKALASMQRGSHLGQIGVPLLLDFLPDQFLPEYDYDFLYRMKCALTELTKRACAGDAMTAYSVLQELVLYLCSREAEAFMKLEAYPQFSEETEINRPGNWVFDLFGDMDLISFLFSGQYLRQDHPYHFSHWNDLQFYMPSVEPKQGLASLFD
ncbi:MAG: helix-turn-helix domain-containing protein [Clostridia bacterium]|nr:helix-turn-helix domain-containing protein [Clostridia bacterium]MBQ5757975.1 helix-turn-helix domain-containing protein [Clostridia bacterium]